MDLQDILYEVEDGVARITLNKPNKLNALSWSSWAEIETVVEAANEDDAAEAEKIGLVSEVVAPDELMQRANALAQEIARGPTLAVEINKRLAREGMERNLTQHIEAEQFLQEITHHSEDAQEGRLSFVEKREPVFKGR